MDTPEMWLMYPTTEKMTKPPKRELATLIREIMVQSLTKFRWNLLYEPKVSIPPKEQAKV